MSAGRPTPSLVGFKREVLSWDFYQDVFDEQKKIQEEEVKAKKELDSQKLDEKEIEEFYFQERLKNLTKAQAEKEKRKIAFEKANFEKLKPKAKEAANKMMLNVATKIKARILARDRVIEHLRQTCGAFEKVPEHFDDETHYIASFLPVFYWECRAQLQRSKDSEMLKEAEKVRPLKLKMDENNLVRLVFSRSKEACSVQQYSMQDLVLLTQEEDLSKPCDVHLLGFVEYSVNLEISITVFLDGAVVSSSSRMKLAADLVAAHGVWYMAKVTSLATQVREYEGLRALPEIFLKESILNRDDSGLVGDASTEMQAASELELGKFVPDRVSQMCYVPEGLETWLQQKYNPSQLAAIRDSLKVEGITLVQGPPGTGKTTTVLAILAVLLASSKEETRSHQADSVVAEVKRPELHEDAEDFDRQSALERGAFIKAKMPWLRPNFVPFSDAEWQEVLRPGRAAKLPYSKVPCNPVLTPKDRAMTPQKVLVCAPSNAAVDEVLRRVNRDGLKGGDGKVYQPPMTRIGPACHPNLKKDYSLREQVDRRLAGCDSPDANRREEETQRVMSISRIIFATLAMCGSRDMVGFAEDLDTVVVDEASQGVEVSTLVPLKLGTRRLILIGDPEQLPATVFSELAKDYCSYDRSLFQRLQATQYKVNMLNTQYRMHPAISRFPSQHFYESQLLDHLNREDFEAANPTAWSHVPCFAPVAFFHMKGDMSGESKSYVNDPEADFVVTMVSTLQNLYKDQDWKRKIGVISPYAKQVHLIKQKFKEKYGVLKRDDPCPIEVATVDGFQGNEKDCIIVSLVRGAMSKGRSVGFLKDRRRMNVAFTRARLNLWVVGNAQVLEVNSDWKEFIDQQQENQPDTPVRDSYVLNVQPPFESWLPRYYKSWAARNAPKESGKVLQETQLEEDLVEAAARPLEISEEELEELRRKQEEEKMIQDDMEEEVEPDFLSEEDEEVLTGQKRKAEEALGDDFVQEREEKRTPAPAGDD